MKKVSSIFLACLIALSLCLSLMVSADESVQVSLPGALAKGLSYDLSAKTDSGPLTLTVNGEACDGTYVADGTQAELVYTDSNGKQVASYTLPVIDTQDSSDQTAYFYDPSGAVSAVENENDVALSFSQDTQVSFINKLNAEDFALYMAFVEGAINYEKVNVKLTDARNVKVSLTFTIDVAAKTVALNGEKAELGEIEDVLQLRYKNRTQKLMLGSDQELMTCSKADNGTAFSGFSGGVYLTIGIEGVNGASTLNLTRVNNQALGHKNSTSPDMAEPVMVTTSTLRSTQFMGEEFDIPSYELYDVLSTVAETSVTVEAPDGEIYTDTFTISQYGKYKLTFIAKDSHGNQMKTIKMIFVNDDVAPELEVASMEKTSYKLGDAVTVPAYTVSDNLEQYNVDVILFLPNSEIRLLTHDETGEITYCLNDSALYSKTFINDNSSFKTEQAGTYTIRYVAYDDQYNRVVQELTFTVE